MQQIVAGLAIFAIVAGVPMLIVARLAASMRPVATAHSTASSPAHEDAEDRAVIAQLHKAGSDPRKPADMVYYLYVPAESDADAAATALRQRGFFADVSVPLGKLSDGTTSTDWGVIAHKTDRPTLDTLRMTQPILRELAAKYHGIYDGWEAAVVK